jgi:hypothetical protein
MIAPPSLLSNDDHRIAGNLRVREKNDGLVAAIELGYPPLPPPDDKDYIIN